jgi:hypothetical protein
MNVQERAGARPGFAGAARQKTGERNRWLRGNVGAPVTYAPYWALMILTLPSKIRGHGRVREPMRSSPVHASFMATYWRELATIGAICRSRPFGLACLLMVDCTGI